MQRKFDDNIAAVSPSFVKLYNQAATAEEYKLDDVAVLDTERHWNSSSRII